MAGRAGRCRRFREGRSLRPGACLVRRARWRLARERVSGGEPDGHRPVRGERGLVPLRLDPAGRDAPVVTDRGVQRPRLRPNHPGACACVVRPLGSGCCHLCEYLRRRCRYLCGLQQRRSAGHDRPRTQNTDQDHRDSDHDQHETAASEDRNRPPPPIPSPARHASTGVACSLAGFECLVLGQLPPSPLRQGRVTADPSGLSGPDQFGEPVDHRRVTSSVRVSSSSVSWVFNRRRARSSRVRTATALTPSTVATSREERSSQ